MKENISISKTAFSDLINAFLPIDDDSGPWGPAGLVNNDRLLWILLNPQPLPPKEGPSPDPWHWISGPVPDPWSTGPAPQPWRTAALINHVINQAFSQYQLAQIMVGEEQLERSTEVIGSQIRRFVDEFCGTKPPRFPWPPKFDPKVLHAIDFFVAGTDLQRAADAMTNEPLQEIFSAAADQLFETGLRQLERSCSENITS